jgi:hypothetical protein
MRMIVALWELKSGLNKKEIQMCEMMLVPDYHFYHVSPLLMLDSLFVFCHLLLCADLQQAKVTTSYASSA